MNPISSITRIICGLGLIVLATSVYLKNRAAMAAGGELQLFGFRTAADSWQVTLGFVAIGLIGLAMLIIGLRSLLQRS